MHNGATHEALGKTTAEEEEKAVATAVAHVDRIRTARKTAHEVTVRELKHIKAEA